MCPHRRAHWCHLANTSESSVCGGDAVFCQITLTTCYYYKKLCYHKALSVVILSTAAHLYQNCILKGLQQVQDIEGHSRSSGMARFDRPDITSYEWSVVTTLLYCTVFFRYYHYCSARDRLHYELRYFYIRIGKRAYMACNFNCRVETEGLLKVIGSHHCESGDTSDDLLSFKVLISDDPE